METTSWTDWANFEQLDDAYRQRFTMLHHPRWTSLVLPDSDPIGTLPDLMRPVRLPVRHSDHTLTIELLALLDDVALLVILEFFARIRQKILVHLRRQCPRWSASRRLFVCWKLEADEVAFWMEEVIHALRPGGSRFGLESAEKLPRQQSAIDLNGKRGTKKIETYSVIIDHIKLYLPIHIPLRASLFLPLL